MAQHRRALVLLRLSRMECANDSTTITGQIGRMVVYVMATVAEMELDSIPGRNASAAQHNIAEGKWRGGSIPTGYRPYKAAEGDWRLIPDEEGLAPILREIVQRLADGERSSTILRDLNEPSWPASHAWRGSYFTAHSRQRKRGLAQPWV